MPNSLGPTGLITAQQLELQNNLTTSLQTIYGSNINVASNTPDGQAMNIFIQVVLDVLNLITNVYNSFDPDVATGVTLDQRLAINGIQRQAGTYTITPITIVTSQSVNLYGLDQTAQAVFTIADNVGNQWQLTQTQTGLAAGTNTFSFQAVNPGAQLTTPNTITVPVTIVLGVTSVNNPTTYSTLGVNEESDANVKLRRQQSVSLSSQGYLSGLRAALLNLPGMSSAFVYENNTGVQNGDTVPAHSIWVITAGSATSAAIANAIYSKRNSGCGMFGATTYLVTQVDGSQFQVAWDTVATQSLFVTFTVTSLNQVNSPNISAVIAGIVANYVPAVNGEVNINALATIAQQADSNTLVTNASFSAGLVTTIALSAVPTAGTFTIGYNGAVSAAINWNDSAATIQTKLQAVTGLSTATVSGSLSSQSLLVTIATAAALIYAASNSLTGVNLTFTPTSAAFLSPATKRNQFLIGAPNIIVLPMQISPSSASVAHGSHLATFTGLGGYAPYTYSLQTNASGGSINASSGVYTSGTTGSVSDVVKVTDAFGNTATATVTVL